MRLFELTIVRIFVQSEWAEILTNQHSGSIYASNAFFGVWISGIGDIPNLAPGVIFADDDDVVPDVVWISRERLAALLPDGKLHTAPELVVEVLSPGSTNARKDREVKLKLYSRRGALEYWVINWQERYIEIYRREEGMLVLNRTLYENDRIQSPLFPGFTCKVSDLYSDSML